MKVGSSDATAKVMYPAEAARISQRCPSAGYGFPSPACLCVLRGFGDCSGAPARRLTLFQGCLLKRFSPYFSTGLCKTNQHGRDPVRWKALPNNNKIDYHQTACYFELFAKKFLPPMKNHPEPLKLWYTTASGNDWNRALPLGSGRLGAMVFGNVRNERIQLNEDTVWSGGPRDRINPDALAALPEIRRLIFAGKLKEAENLTDQALSGVPDSQHQYEPLADLLIAFDHAELAVPERSRRTVARALSGMLESQQKDANAMGSATHTVEGATHYRRELDLATAVAGLEYKTGETTFKRELLASAPDEVIAIRLSASKPGAIGFSLRLQRGPIGIYSARYADTVTQAGGRALLLKGRTAGEGAISFATCIGGVAKNGKLFLRGETLLVEGADEVLLVLAAGTTFREKDPAAESLARLEKALSHGWDEIKKRHLAEYRGWFDRVTLTIGHAQEDEAAALPTDKRIERMAKGADDPALLALYFQYGRYLLIGSSRPGSMPANLQGIWNQDFYPAWGSKYTININTEMNYWPVETCNLSELHEPLFDLLERVRVKGREVARRMYGCGGFVIHHNTDLWDDACPTDRNLAASFWPMGGAWLSLHLWEHYAFTGDRDFLRRAYDTLKEASQFFLEFLVEDSKKRLVTCPAISPENVYILPNGEMGTLCAGSSMDNQIIDQLFRFCGEAAQILDADKEFRAKLEAARQRLPQPSIGRRGQLMEWPEDYDESEPGHRHVSHLFALHPGDRISPLDTPDLAQAARVTLEGRLAHGGGHTGWSRAWIINFWARLHDGEKALQNLNALLAKSTLPNLFDDHPPFQIDGNFGATSGLAEMLLQSQRKTAPASLDSTYELHLLPALPAAWKSGRVTGLRARGGSEVDLDWRDGKLSAVTIRSARGGACRLRYGAKTKDVSLKAGESLEIKGSQI